MLGYLFEPGIKSHKEATNKHWWTCFNSGGCKGSSSGSIEKQCYKYDTCT